VSARYAWVVRPYRRKLSGEDAGTGTILITKDRWRAFPRPMQEFAVDVAGLRFATRIVAEDCACVPPPHQHLHLEAGHFRHLLDFTRGAIVEVEVDDGVCRVRNG
jgi:hypothetical protein